MTTTTTIALRTSEGEGLVIDPGRIPAGLIDGARPGRNRSGEWPFGGYLATIVESIVEWSYPAPPPSSPHGGLGRLADTQREDVLRAIWRRMDDIAAAVGTPQPIGT